VLVAPARSDLDVDDVARELASQIEAAGDDVLLKRLRELGHSRETGPGQSPETPDLGKAHSGRLTLESLRAFLAAGRGYVVLVGRGILDDSNSILAAAAVDAVLVVAKSGRTGRQDLARTRDEIERAGGRLIGAVLLR
jgi:hypothetical protein